VSRSWKGGSTRAWRRTRRAVLERDRYRCQLQLPGCTGRATVAHHVKGKAMGDDPKDLLAACSNCNGKVGDPTRHDPDPTPWHGW